MDRFDATTSTRTGASRSIGKPATSSSTQASSLDDIGDVWASEPLFYPAKPPAHPLMVAELAGRLLIVPDQPLAAGWRRRNTGDRRRCRPNGCYVAADHLARRYREDR